MACRKKARDAQYRSMASTSLGHHKKDKWKSKKTVLITDAEQKKIDQACFIKTALTYESKCYKPGDPEWDAIVKTITPLPKYYKEKLFTEDEREKLWIEKQEEGFRFVMGEKILVKTEEEEEAFNQLVMYYRGRNINVHKTECHNRA